MTFEPPSQPTPTSRAAARAARHSSARVRAMIRNHLVLCGSYGATDPEIQAALNLSGDTERPRRGDLFKAGFCIDSGFKRPTASGLMAIVWRAA